jgi:CRP-like cAMP-binding protein
MKKSLTISILKKEFGHLVKLDDEVYKKILPYLSLRSYNKSVVLKKAGEIDPYARYIIKGTLAKMWPSEKGRDFRVKIFCSKNIASDLGSYLNKEPSGYLIKTLTYVSVIELARPDMDRILNEIPEISRLAAVLTSNALSDSSAWQNIIDSPIKEGILKMHKQFPEALNYMSIKDKAYIFKTSVSKYREIIAELV